MSGDPPLSAAAAAQFGWTDQVNVEGRRQALESVDGSGPAMFVPGFWDVVAPLENTFNLVAGGEGTAGKMLDEAAPRMQESLDQGWRTWDEIT